MPTTPVAPSFLKGQVVEYRNFAGPKSTSVRRIRLTKDSVLRPSGIVVLEGYRVRLRDGVAFSMSPTNKHHYALITPTGYSAARVV